MPNPQTIKPAPAGSCKTYRLYGITLASDFRPVNWLRPGSGTADVRYTYINQGVAVDSTVERPRTPLPPTDDWGKGTAVAHQGYTYVYRFPDAAEFYIGPRHITGRCVTGMPLTQIEIYLLGPVLALWLESRGLPALHAATVTVAGKAAAVLANARGGKTSLAATLMQEGCPLLCDDLLCVEERQDTFFGRPAYPQMRMWPVQAQHFLGRCDDLEPVHPAYDKRRIPVGPGGFGAFCEETTPLSCIYLPQRRDPAENDVNIEIRPLSPKDAVIELARHSFLASNLETLGLQARRITLLARLAERVPLRRILYPDGYQHLPRVGAAILEDLSRTLA